jgi:hypothetical protein
MSAATPSLAHRTISNIRTGTGYSPGSQANQNSPQTPSRAIPSAFGSPSTLRAEEDVIVVEIGSRSIRVGFAGDPNPQVELQLGPNQRRRVGDHRIWGLGYQDDWNKRCAQSDWARGYEIWQHDIRDIDLGLVQDKFDRLLREAFTQ